MSTVSDFSEKTDLTGEANWMNDTEELAALEGDYPHPLLWRMLVLPIKPKKQTRSGIVIPMQAQEAQQYLNYVGRVVHMGALCYLSHRMVHYIRRAGVFGRLLDAVLGPVSVSETSIPKPGDYVIYGRYAGQPILHRQIKLLFINDDEVLGLVRNPDALKVYV